MRPGIAAMGRTPAPAAIAAAWVLWAATAGGAEPTSPFVRLFDTAKTSATALPPEAVAGRTGWVGLAEGDVSHRFAGDAAFANDRLAVVIRAKGGGAEVYCLSPGGARRRLLLVPCSAVGRPAGAIGAIRIVENTPAAVMLEADFTAAGGGAGSMRFRLTAGVASVETRAGKGAGAVSIEAAMHHVVVPDLFADDMVLAADDLGGPRLGLPAENIFLGLLDEGGAMLVCLWRSNEQNADVMGGGSAPAKAIAGCRVQCPEGQSVWAGLLEGPAIWHARPLAPGQTGAEVALDWRPPFPAKWRCNLVGPGGVTRSGPLDADSPRVRPTATENRIVVYPIDRVVATPLTVLCPIDVMRNTLGVGVCQYVLDVEGLGGEEHPTPGDVTGWVEKLLERKRHTRSADAIRERLGLMVGYVRSEEARIAEYQGLARRLRGACVQAAGGEGDDATVRGIVGVLDGLEHDLVAAKAGTGAAAMAKLAAGLVELLAKPQPLAECRRLCAAIRAIGAADDAALARCRMALRRIKQLCRSPAALHPATAKWAGDIREQAEQMLRKK